MKENIYKEEKSKDKKATHKFSKKHVVVITIISFLIISVIIGSAFGFYALGVTYGKTVITLDETRTYQVFQGFGASSAWVYQSFGLSENTKLKYETKEAL